MSYARIWEEIFKKYNILEEIKKNGQYRITSGQLSDFKEARLLTYFDEQANLPKIFIDNGLTIIPITKGEYLIGAFDLYRPLNYKIEKVGTVPQTNLETLKQKYLNNESSAILLAFNTEILHDAFEIDELSFTMNGRVGTQPFSFNIHTKDLENRELKVDKVQIEIDAGFESEEEIFIIEAKNRFVGDINLRQLFYPFKYWSEKVSKEVKPVFLVYSDSAFHIFVCTFKDPADINSFEITSSKKYLLETDEPITFETVSKLLKEIKPHVNRDCQFPQADCFEKIIDLINYINSNTGVSSRDVAELFHFEIRQSAYYSTAAKFLGLVEIKKGAYSLSERGKAVVNMPYRKRHLELIKLILSDIAFNEVFKKTIEKDGEIPSKKEIASTLCKYYLGDKASEKTLNRRSGTVSGWIRWILDTIE